MAKSSGRRLGSEETSLLMESLRKYRVLAGQLSNTCFNLSQKLRTPEHGYESTLKLVRDFDAADNGLFTILKRTRLLKRLDETEE